MTSHKRILNYVFTSIIAGVVMLVILLVAKQETAGFNKSLYILQHSSKTTGLYFYDIIGRIAASSVLTVLGVMCIFLSMLSRDNGGFLRCARMFFFAAGFTSTLWDYKIMFYLSSAAWRARLFYLGDIWLVWYEVSIINLLFGMADARYGKRITAVTVSGAAALTAALCLSHITEMLRYEMYYSILIGIALVVFFTRLVYRNFKEAKKRLLRVGVGICYMLECVVVMAFSCFIFSSKMRTGSIHYKFYLEYSSFCIMGFSLLIFYQFFQFERTGSLFGGQENLKLQEIKKQRQELGQIIARNCIGPLNLISAQVGLLLNKTGSAEDKRILEQITEKLDRLRDYFHGLNTQEIDEGSIHAREHIKFNLENHLKYVVDLYEKSVNSEKGHILRESMDVEDSIVEGDPYELLQANLKLIKLLLRVSVDRQLRLKERRDGEKVYVSMETAYLKARDGLPKQIRRILCSRKGSPRLSNLDDVAIFNIRCILHNQDADISVKSFVQEEVPVICVSYSLKCHPAASLREEPWISEKDDMDMILLLSSSKEQENTIRTYLAGENYKIAVFQQGDEVLEFIERQPNIRTIIIDSASYAIGMGDIAERIREFYPIEMLPILLVCPAGFQKLLQKESFRYINDVLVEPFDKAGLSRKIYAMALLQDSARRSLSTRLDFLQSQMDPHFIFNTLSAIMPLCITNSHEAYEMLTDFSNYLRGRLYPQELQHPVCIEREIELVTAFLAIEQKRFLGRIEYHMDLDYSKDSTIIPLLIEPIVENCVIHGMREEGVLHIDVSILQDGEFIYCSVKDDGKGFDSKNFLQNVEKSPSRSIGIKNVRERLKIYYHEDIYITGVPGKGTEVSFKFRCV